MAVIIVPIVQVSSYPDQIHKGGGAGSEFSRMVLLRCWGGHGRRISTRHHRLCQFSSIFKRDAQLSIDNTFFLGDNLLSTNQVWPLTYFSSLILP